MQLRKKRGLELSSKKFNLEKKARIQLLKKMSACKKNYGSAGVPQMVQKRCQFCLKMLQKLRQFKLELIE